jgi:prevent-host-death family protein
MRATSVEVAKNFGQFADRALTEPVKITKYGREHLVLMSAAEYDRLMQRDRQVYGIGEFPPDLVEAVRNAKMDERHAHLDDELKDWQP